MKAVSLLICLCQYSFVATSQSLGCVELSQSYNKKIVALSTSINRRSKSEKQSAKLLVKKAHRQFLKTYHAYATMSDVFEKGNYDCLSGTYFLSLGLSNLGIKHRIIETNYHIFLIADTDQGEILIESTDQYEGFISNKRKIEEKISFYNKNLSETGNHLYLSHLKIYHEVLPFQLSGLLYFNLAVQSYNQNDLIASCEYLKSAWNIYDNPRIEEFMPILTHSIMSSPLSEQQKNSLNLLLKSHQRQQLTSMVTR